MTHQELGLSDHFSWEEACRTDHQEIDNTIPKTLYSTIQNTARGMERIRALLSHPISVNSWYRSPELNKAVGGRVNSQHLLGEAVDFTSASYGTPLEIVRKIAHYPDLINFDQLILEHRWVHVSFTSIPGVVPRHQVLTLTKSGNYKSGITDLMGNPA